MRWLTGRINIAVLYTILLKVVVYLFNLILGTFIMYTAWQCLVRFSALRLPPLYFLDFLLLKIFLHGLRTQDYFTTSNVYIISSKYLHDDGFESRKFYDC